MNELEAFEPHPKEAMDRAIELRKGGMSLRAVERETGISREAVRLNFNNKYPELIAKFTNRPKKRTRVRIRSVTKKKNPKPNYNTSRQYDFLQYARLVYKWAIANYGLKRAQIDLLLYLYPRGVFAKSKFYEYHKVVGLYQRKTMDFLIREGWISIWRPKKGQEVALYGLTNKAKTMCSDMHKYCVGDKQIPIDSKKCKLSSDKSVRMNRYYVDQIRKMNRKREKERGN